MNKTILILLTLTSISFAKPTYQEIEKELATYKKSVKDLTDELQYTAELLKARSESVKLLAEIREIYTKVLRLAYNETFSTGTFKKSVVNESVVIEKKDNKILKLFAYCLELKKQRDIARTESLRSAEDQSRKGVASNSNNIQQENSIFMNEQEQAEWTRKHNSTEKDSIFMNERERAEWGKKMGLPLAVEDLDSKPTEQDKKLKREASAQGLTNSSLQLEIELLQEDLEYEKKVTKTFLKVAYIRKNKLDLYNKATGSAIDTLPEDSDFFKIFGEVKSSLKEWSKIEKEEWGKYDEEKEKRDTRLKGRTKE